MFLLRLLSHCICTIPPPSNHHRLHLQENPPHRLQVRRPLGDPYHIITRSIIPFLEITLLPQYLHESSQPLKGPPFLTVFPFPRWNLRTCADFGELFVHISITNNSNRLLTLDDCKLYKYSVTRSMLFILPGFITWISSFLWEVGNSGVY